MADSDRITVAEWQKRLADTFTYKRGSVLVGPVYGFTPLGVAHRERRGVGRTAPAGQERGWRLA